MNKREIKFRAFDNFRKKMIDTGYHVIGEVTMFGIIDQWVEKHRGDTPSLEYYNNIVESQFTGRKDNNSVDIYEGDIVKFTAIWNVGAKEYGSSEPKKNEELIYVMEWVEESEYGEYDYSGYNFHHWRTADKVIYEVIGNIYENPELVPNE